MISRQFLLFIVAVSSLLGSIVATAASIQQHDFDLRGYVDPVSTLDLPFKVPRFGVNAELGQYSAEELATQLDLMRQINVNWIRQTFSWASIQPERGEWNWATADRIVATVANEADFELVAVLTNSPAWARSEGASSTAPPEDITDFVVFVEAFAQRYGDDITYYQIWDEPNIELGWGGIDPRPGHYMALLSTTYDAIHENDPDATVIAAALAPTSENNQRNINERAFLDALYAHGLADASDAIAAKPYGFEYAPANRDVDIEILNFSRLVLIREVMSRHGDAKTALWASNWGWNSLPTDWTGNPSIWGQVTAQQQQTFTLDALERAEREWPWLGGMILHTWQPDVPPDDPQWGFALIDQQGNPTALWQTLAQRPPTETATNGLYPARNPYATYSGIWTFSDLGADIGWVQDSTIALDFAGTEIALIVRQGDFLAYFYPSIDFGEANALPDDASGNPFLSLRSDNLQSEVSLVTLASGLDEQPNRLVLIADELVPDALENRWPLVGFAVSSGDLRKAYNNQVRLGWISILVTGLLVAGSAYHGIVWPNTLAQLSRFPRHLTLLLQLILGGLASLALMFGMMLTWGDGMPQILRRDAVSIALSMATSGLIYLNDVSFLLTLFALLVLFWILYHRPQIGLMLALFYAPFFLFPVELYHYAFPISEVVLWLTLAAYIARALANLRRQNMQTFGIRPDIQDLFRSVKAIDLLVLAWLVLALISILWTQRIDPAITELRTMIVLPVIFYGLMRVLITDRNTFYYLIAALVISGALVAGIGLIQWFRGDAIITAEGGARRLASVYGSPNNVGLLLGRTLPFALAGIFIFHDALRRSLILIAILLMLAAVLLSQSAGALFIGIPTIIGFMLLMLLGRRALLPLLLLGGILLIGTALAVQSARFERLTDFSSGTNFYRLRVWESAINLIEDHPVTGIGLDQFLYEFRDTYMIPDAWEEPDLSHPHNFMFDWWLRLGLPGLVLFLFIQAVFWRKLWRVYFQSQGASRLVILALMAAMLNTLTHGLIDNSVFVIDLALIFVFLLGSSIVIENIGAIDVTP